MMANERRLAIKIPRIEAQLGAANTDQVAAGARAFCLLEPHQGRPDGPELA
jgi:hypothetical protein